MRWFFCDEASFLNDVLDSCTLHAWCRRWHDPQRKSSQLCFSLAKLQYTNWDTYGGPTQTTSPMQNCLREGYLSRSAYTVASAKVAATCCNDLFTWRDVVTILVQKRNRKNWKMTILCLWKEGGSLMKSGALCHVIGSHDELMETLEKWNGKAS